MTRVSFALAVALFAACSNSTPNNTPDAKVFKDSAAATVQSVTCPATPAATIMTSAADAYSPTATTITQGQIIKFVMDPLHNVAPNTTGSDPGLNIGFGATGCLMFTHSGTFGFHCAAHGFTGSVTVN